jgi:hypothetical protein
MVERGCNNDADSIAQTALTPPSRKGDCGRNNGSRKGSPPHYWRMMAQLTFGELAGLVPGAAKGAFDELDAQSPRLETASLTEALTVVSKVGLDQVIRSGGLRCSARSEAVCRGLCRDPGLNDYEWLPHTAARECGDHLQRTLFRTTRQVGRACQHGVLPARGP